MPGTPRLRFLLLSALALTAGHAACGGSSDEPSAEFGSELGPLTIVDHAHSLGVSALIAVGDVNGDGLLTGADLSAVETLAANPSAAVSCEAAADIDGDGLVTTSDASDLADLLSAANPGDTLHPTLRPQPHHLICDSESDVAGHHLVTPGGSVPIVLLDSGATITSLSGPGYLQSIDGTTAFVVAYGSAVDGAEIHLRLATTAGPTELTVTVDSVDGMNANAARDELAQTASGSTSSTGTTSSSSTSNGGAGASSSSNGGAGASSSSSTSNGGAGASSSSSTSNGGAGASSSSSTSNGGAGPSSSSSSGTGGYGSSTSSTGGYGASSSSSGGAGGAGGGECPQLGNGCCALLLDFSPANSPISRFADWDRNGKPYGGDEIGETEGLLKDACTLTMWQARNYKLRPKPTRRVAVLRRAPNGTIERVIVTLPEATYNQMVAQWQAANGAALMDLTVAIQTHQACVAKEPESAIELTFGHGMPNHATNTVTAADIASPSCGKWVASAGVSLDRGPFIGDNYNNTAHNVCHWTMFDMSCFSGRSTAAFAYANNAQGPSCATPAVAPAEVTASHAGHDSDAGLASAKYNQVCPGRDGNRQIDELQVELARGPIHVLNHELPFPNFAATYSDAGYTTPGISYNP
jgi:Dockerin type I domain